MENMGSARHRISSSILITSEAGLPTRCGEDGGTFRLLLYGRTTRSIHFFTKNSISWTVWISPCPGKSSFSSLTAYHSEIGKTAVSPHAHGVLAFGTVPRQCQPSEVHADHFLDGWDTCNLERSRRLRTRLEGSPVGDIEWDRWHRSPVPPFKGDHCGCSCSCAAITS
ncbi:uncharacterized protein K444DRAFT_47627 [Hyaloscypha bicolor E]|uniref:Uncharacterized protein n=1 Tax=Hyaloscypha bicolor E TaxID=1095630 RepID=A0A2J6T278_9HELO|nr:uncharacterized protein K444DRAFT_47627 [Hyaloscypha bicolor E]PMD57132.1 hypothetical protein K444DRAFT_47627 [Hyaloscypha bicolor E]